MELKALQELFAAKGGTFCAPLEEWANKANMVSGFIFDWDGVFHMGQKGVGHSGLFSEADSMGLNMLRYGFWRRFKVLPFMAIISGERDKTAPQFAEREHFNAVYTGIGDKKKALEHTCASANVSSKQMACFFDDVNDLSMARYCGLRFQIQRSSSPLFSNFTMRNRLCDYLTAHSPGEHAIRECCELLLGIWGVYDETITSRMRFDSDYQKYWDARNKEETLFYTRHNTDEIRRK